MALDIYALAAKPPSSTATVHESLDPSQQSGGPSPYQCSRDCVSAIARTLQSVNPLLLGDGLLASCARVLMEGLDSSEHELQTFEVLLALTNLASFRSESTDMPEVMCPAQLARSKKDSTTFTSTSSTPLTRSSNSSSSSSPLNAWVLGKSQLTSTNPQIQRAGVELLTNLCSATWVRTRLRGVPAEIRSLEGEKVREDEHAQSLNETLASDLALTSSDDLRLLLVFALSDDLPTQLAATGALAMLSNDPLLARRIATMRVVSYVPMDEAEEEKSSPQPLQPNDPIPPNGTKPIVRTGDTIVDKLLKSKETNEDVRIRINVLKQNIDEANTN